MKARMQAPLRFVQSEEIASNYPAASIKTSSDELVTIMQFVEQLLPEQAIVICQRLKQPSVQYASSNCLKVFGYSSQEIMRMSLPDFLTLVHQDDVEEVNQCFAFINSLEPYNPLFYRFKLHYRLKHKNGTYINLVDEKMAMKGAGGKYIYLNSFRDVTSEEKFYDVKLDIYKNERGELKKIQTYIPRLSQIDFTPRQKDIVNLICKGFTNSEIARELSLSVHTVKNHKSIMFRKVNVRNTIELLDAASTLSTIH